MRWLLAISASLVAVLVVTGCSPGVGPKPAGRNPSPISLEVCSTEARTEIAEALGGPRFSVSMPTWQDDVYACNYAFSEGTVRMSVKELSSKSETNAYFEALARQFGDKQMLDGLGQGAFLTDNGSVVVRKDWKVLLVDSTRLTAPITTAAPLSGTPAEAMAAVILACWAGD